MSRLASSIVDVVSTVAKTAAPLHAPEIAGEEWTYVKDCLDVGWVSSVGSYVDRFERELAAYTGAKHVVLTGTGTAALHTCLILAGVARDDEVIIPALTFVATANAVAYCGAVPHFCDSETKTLGLDPDKLEAHLEVITDRRNGQCFNRQTGRRIAAVVCMHTYGHPVQLDRLKLVCDRFGLPLVEDAAESLGSFYKDRHTGNDGLVAAISFNGNKIVTTGGGGAVLTNDSALAIRAKHITTTAKKPHAWEFDHDEIGYNYRMTNVNAAIGCAQLERLPDFLARKRELAARYAEAISALDGVRFFLEPEDCVSNYWLNVILLDDDDIDLRNATLQALNDAGRMSRPAWVPMHHLKPFLGSPRADLTVAESLYRRLINIPSSPNLV